MDILASMLAYLVCVSGVAGALVLGFVLAFAPPGFLKVSPASRFTQTTATHATVLRAAEIHVTAKQAAAMVVKPPVVTTVAEAKPAVKVEPAKESTASVSHKDAAAPVATDAQQKPPASRRQLRRVGDTERARRLAYREGSSFESRFLHYND